MAGSAVPEARVRRRRRLPAEARREKLVEAAQAVFAARGYDAASLEEIAAAAGVSRPVVYDHFRSKKDLYLQLVEQLRNEVFDEVAAGLAHDSGASVAERAHRAIDGFFRYVEMHPSAWRILFREIAGDAEVGERQRRIQAEANMGVAALLAREPGLELAASLHGPHTLEMVAESIGSALNGLARWWYDHRHVPRHQVVGTAFDVVWLGVERMRPRERS